jgi:hypothetical protein
MRANAKGIVVPFNVSLVIIDHVLFWVGLGMMPGCPLSFACAGVSDVLGFGPGVLLVLPAGAILVMAWSLMAMVLSGRMAYASLRAGGALLALQLFINRMYLGMAQALPDTHVWLSDEDGHHLLGAVQVALLAAFLASAVRWLWQRHARKRACTRGDASCVRRSRQ